MATNNAINTGKPIEVFNGGTGVATLTDHGVVLGHGTAALSAIAGSTGQTLMGSTGADPAWTGSPSFSGSVTAGTGLTVTTGNAVISAGNLTLPATNAGRTQGVIVSGGSNFIQAFGTDNFFAGFNSGNAVTTAANATSVGSQSSLSLTSGNEQCAFGYGSCAANTQGVGNSGFGYLTLGNMSGTSSAYNTALGWNVLSNIAGSCAYNIGIGYQSGVAYTTTESSNILISNSGVIGESHVTRIGTSGGGASQQNKCYIAGIDGVNVGSVSKVLTMASDQLGTATLTAGTGVTITPGANTITIASTVTSGIGTLNGDTGSATGSTVTIAGGSNITTSATGSTLTVDLDSTVSISGSMTAGTGLTATTGNVTITSGNLVMAATASTSVGTIKMGSNTILSMYSGSGGGLGDSNTFVGASGAAGNFTSTGIGNSVYGWGAGLNLGNGQTNSLFGRSAGIALTSANDTTLLGSNAGLRIEQGSSNTAVGAGSLLSVVNTGPNTALGFGAGSGSGSAQTRNVFLGHGTGSNYTSTESNNILIGSNVTGTVSDNNTIRIGNNGSSTDQQSKCFIAGIDGVNVGSVAKVLTMASNQLGTATITAGTGVSVTAGANTITIAAAGTTVLTYTAVNTSPYTVLTTDNYLAVDSSGGIITVRLPNSTTTGKVFIVKDTTGSSATNNITVTTPGGSVTLDGATTFVMNTAYQAIQVIFNGSNYEIF